MVRDKIVLTSLVEKHRHIYSKGNKYTSYDKKHKHEVKGKKALPATKKGHTHKILLRLAEI